MFTSLAVTALLASSVLVARADPNPNTPGTGAVYNAGAACPIAWDVDATGLWTTMNIELMTGDNFNMVHLTTVATVDGTTASTFSWTCPGVTPNSAIYFYQFTSPASNNTLWTTRFAIASASGTTTPPPQTTQPGGAKIPWGTGALTDPSAASAAPSYEQSAGGASSTGASAPASSAAAGSTSATSVVVTPTTSAAPIDSTTASSSSAETPASSSGSAAGAATTNAAVGSMSVDSRLFKTALALGVSAIGFAAFL